MGKKGRGGWEAPKEKSDSNFIVIKIDRTKRKMNKDELEMYIRRRGAGEHGRISTKTERRKEKQALKRKWQGGEI